MLKCNHDSGGIAICTDRANFDWQKQKKKLTRSFRSNYYYLSREWAYKGIVPCIIAEKYMLDEKANDLMDYKFFCFNGVPKYVQVDFDRFTRHKRNIYDMDWNFVPLTIKCPNDPAKVLEKPEKFDEMKAIAAKLSAGLPEARIDLYFVNGRIYFGEFTIYHGSGIEKFTPESYGEEFGSYIDLSLCVKEDKNE